MLNFSITITAMIVWLFGGGVLLAVAASWKPQPGKRLFVAYVSIMFLVLPILELVFFTTWMYWENYVAQQWYPGRGYLAVRRFNVFYFTNLMFIVLALLSSQWLLILYALGRRRSSESSDGCLAGTGLMSKAQFQDDGRVWDVLRPGAELVAILRRREWAFLIDSAPCVLFFVGFIFVLSVISRENVYNSTADLIAILFLCAEILGILYLVVRDIVDGRSIGKRIAGCRAVDFKTGRVLRFEQAVTRNLVFLIPLFPLVELAAASFRADRRRFGDLIAGTIVVHGEPDFIDGVVQVVRATPKAEKEALPVKHALDD